MSYVFLDKEPVEEAVRRVAQEQIDQAIATVQDDAVGPHETIHEIRKRCKELRGLIRLVRPVIGDTYAFENARFRDAAGTLSEARDATARIETYEALMERYSDEVDRRAFGPIRRALTMHRRDLVETLDLDSRLAAFLDEMQQARHRATSWSVEAEGFEALAGGLQKTYRRGRQAMEEAYAEPTPENFHEWRKRVKYHWYHSQLLQRIWPSLMEPWTEAFHQLSDFLGDAHDLAIFRKAVLSHPERYGNMRSMSAFIGLLDRRRDELRCHANPLGQRLYAEKPEALSHRWECAWDARRTETNMPLSS